MATSTGFDYMNQFAVSNQAIKDLRELLFLTILETGDLNRILDVNLGVEQGSRVGGVGEMEPVGRPSTGCKPNWKGSKIATAEKQWLLGQYEVPEEICYADLESTIVQHSMRTGTDRADLTGTDYMDAIVIPVLTKALEKMIMRLAWFGDTEADDITGGGIITDGIDPVLFHVCDGLWKRIFALTSASPLQRITIAANSAATKANQISGIRASGVATKIMDDLIYNADPKILQTSDRVLLVTKSIADALAMDIKANNKGSDLQWQSIFGGFASATVYNQQEIISLPVWDEMIRMFEDDGTIWNKPHRAIYAPKSSLKFGVESKDLIAFLKIWFNDDDQVNRMLVKDKVGTMTWEDNLIMAAF